MPGSSQRSGAVTWGWASAALEGPESGDLQVVIALPHGALLVVVDALGHGPEAAIVAQHAEAILRAHAATPVQELVERCHEGLRKTRGVVMTLASFDARSRTIDCCGVGNVEGILFRGDAATRPAREGIPTRGGVVGYRLPPLKVTTISVYADDTLVLATDGIHSDFPNIVDITSEPQLIADAVLAQCAKGTDDELVLVARFLGVNP
jgi:negative regulator of sigma-B (phosphoserine phosphatase)